MTLKSSKLLFALAIATTSSLLLSGFASAQLYVPGDQVIAIDTDGNSSFPLGEDPDNCVDQNSATKYLNFGGNDTGLIITPQVGATVVQSLQLTTANDFPERDPSSYVLYGTNDPITSPENSLGDEEDWIMISTGTIALPDTRFSPSEIVDFVNLTSYTSYKLVFPTLKSENIFTEMQIADAQLFSDVGGAGTAILAEGDFTRGINDDPADFSLFPAAESPDKVIDQTLDKYLNFGFVNSGFIISRSDNAAVVINGFTITTANDFFERDPSSYEIYGTNDPVTSAQNSTGEEENWTLVDSGMLELPEARLTESDMIAVDNTAAFTAYRVLFPTIRLPANSMQIAEMTFAGKVSDVLLGDVNCDGVVDLLDVGPFVDVISGAAPFSAKADINQDGIASLLDVAPFVAILTGG